MFVLSCRENFQTESINIEHSGTYQVPEIIAPKYREILFIHQEHEIIWYPLSNTMKIKIELYRKEYLIHTLSLETDNDGSYKWIVPAVNQSNMYKIKITDLKNRNNYIFSAYFTIRER